MKLKTIIFLITLNIVMISTFAQENWKPVQGNISTIWSEKVDPNNVLPEYPRPQLVREDWKNLNGLWNYTLTKLNENPNSYNNKILVPFPIESSLSGVKKQINDSTLLWYNKSFSIPKSWNGKRILLHFEAVDWQTKVWINDNYVGEHKGGYDPFYFDITKFINDSRDQYLTISVWDPTDKGTQPCGKQTSKPGGIFYTSTTGIWQTVWLEPVGNNYITDYKIYPKIDQNSVKFNINTNQQDSALTTNLIIKKNSDIIESYNGILKDEISLKIDSPILWNPDNPFLYDFEIQLIRKNKVVDKISGYFGMRKVAIDNNDKGNPVIKINNQFIFQNGPLDQGFWPDGIYTAPTDEALKSDIVRIKELGFNMLRKHVKVESRRFYYWCDKLGILVWQDMPSGDTKIWPDQPDILRSKESSDQYKTELKQMIKMHFNHPSIIMWVPFNEGWGQFDTPGIVKYIKELDPTRLVDNTSGWADRNVGDVYDIHNYPEPKLPKHQKNRAIVLGEFGGLSLSIANHLWTNNNWGYVSFENSESYLSTYEDYYTTIWGYVKDSSLSAVVYTQLTDVETEINGLLTYDRKVCKLDKNFLYNINTNNFLSPPKINPSRGLLNKGDKISLLNDNDSTTRIFYTIDGSTPNYNSTEYLNDQIILRDDLIIKAVAFKDTMQSRIVTAKFFKTDLIKPIYKFTYNKKYSAGGDFGLLDKQFGTLNFNDGKWQGFEENDFNVLTQLRDGEHIDIIKINFLEDTDRWIFPPSKVECFGSIDGIHFDSIDVKNIIQPAGYEKPQIRKIKFSIKNNNYIYFKIIAKNIRKCPKWHNGKDGKAWLFVDEISMY